jgi:hypothetical protein
MFTPSLSFLIISNFFFLHLLLRLHSPFVYPLFPELLKSEHKIYSETQSPMIKLYEFVICDGNSVSRDIRPCSPVKVNRWSKEHISTTFSVEEQG